MKNKIIKLILLYSSLKQLKNELKKRGYSILYDFKFDGKLYLENDAMIVFDMGYNSFKIGMPFNTNPYNKNNNPYHYQTWNEGWKSGQEIQK